MRKFIFVRTEINFLAEGNFSLCGRGILSLRKGSHFRSNGREFLFGQKLPALRKEGNFPSKENSFSKAGKLLFQARKVLRLRPSARAASAGVEAYKRRSPRVSRSAYSGAFAWRRASEGEGDSLRGGRSLASEGKTTAFKEEGALLQRGKSLASGGEGRSFRRGYLISQAPPAQETAPSSSALVYCLPEKSTLFQSTGLYVFLRTSKR